jgi:hypothetical protein
MKKTTYNPTDTTLYTSSLECSHLFEKPCALTIITDLMCQFDVALDVRTTFRQWDDMIECNQVVRRYLAFTDIAEVIVSQENAVIVYYFDLGYPHFLGLIPFSGFGLLHQIRIAAKPPVSSFRGRVCSITKMILMPLLIEVFLSILFALFTVAFFTIGDVSISRFPLRYVKLIDVFFFLAYKADFCEEQERFLLDLRRGEITFTRYTSRPVSITRIFSPEVTKGLFNVALGTSLCSCAWFEVTIFLRLLFLPLSCALSFAISTCCFEIRRNIVQWIEKNRCGGFPLFALGTLYIPLSVLRSHPYPMLAIIRHTFSALRSHSIQMIFALIEVFSRGGHPLFATSALLFGGRIRYSSIHVKAPILSITPEDVSAPLWQHDIYTSSIPQNRLKSQSIALSVIEMEVL